MKIQVLEQIRHGRDVFEVGDTRTVSDDLGKYFCRCGWAKDLDGRVRTQARSTTDVVLAPGNLNHATSAGNVNG